MFKNLSKSRFILILCVAIFLLVVIISQFIALSILRNKAQALNDQLIGINEEIAKVPEDVSYDDKKDYARWEKGYVYDDENILIEQ